MSSLEARTARVLVVEDDAMNRHILMRSLEAEGLTVVEADDGQQALDFLLRESFDLVLLDLLMPNVGGLEVLEHLKRDANLKHVPVIMVSGIEETERAVRCIELGAEDYLNKPFNPALLAARVRASLARKRLHDLEREHRDLVQQLFDRHVGFEVARQALLNGADFSGETVEASALFVDVTGSTKLAQELAPKDLISALNAFFDTVVDAVAAEGGWVNKFEGDAALCVFGAPMEQPDHATRALRAARRLRSALAVTASEHLGVDAGIGVSSGQVVAGNVGARDRYEYTVLGDPVNEASRLVAEAKVRPERLLASGAAIQRAERSEQARWGSPMSLQLRDRQGVTLAFVPSDS